MFFLYAQNKHLLSVKENLVCGLPLPSINVESPCVSMYFEGDKGPNKNGLQARFGPHGTIWEPLGKAKLSAGWALLYLPVIESF